MRKSLLRPILAPLVLCGALTAYAQELQLSKTERASSHEKEAEQQSTIWDAATIRRAIHSRIQAAEAWEQASNLERTALNYREAANLADISGDSQNARRLLRRGIKALKQPNSSEEYSRALSKLALIDLAAGQANRCKSNFEKAIFIAHRVRGNAALADGFFAAAEYSYNRRELNLAAEQYLRSIEHWKNNGDRAGEAKGLLYLGYVGLDKGDYVVGLERLNHSLRLWTEIGNKRGIALTHIALGHLYSTSDEKRNALTHYKIAESMFPEAVDLVESARLSAGLGYLYENFGDWDQAIRYREKALRLFQQDGYLYGQLATLASLITLNGLVNKEATARAYFDDALVLAERLNDKYYAAFLNQEIALIYLNSDRPLTALSHLRRSQKILRTFESPRLTALEAEKLGLFFEKLGDYSSARSAYTKSLTINRSLRQRFAEAYVLFRLANVCSKAKDLVAGLSYLEESIALAEELSETTYHSKLRRYYLASSHDVYQLKIGLLINGSGQTNVETSKRIAFSAAERSRSRSMIDGLRSIDVNFAVDGDAEIVYRERDILRSLNTKSDKLTDLVSRNTDEPEIRKLEGEINELQNQLEEIKAELKQKSPVYSAIKSPPPFDLADFQTNILNQDEILLEYFLGKEESYLWLVGKDTFEAFVLPPKDEIGAKIDTLREILDAWRPRDGESIQGQRARIAEADAQYGLVARELSNIILGPVVDKLRGKRLIVVADGKLHYFPISALPLPNAPSDNALLLTNEVVYQPSAQAYSLLKTIRQNQPPANEKDLLVFSDPVFNITDPRLTGVETAPDDDASRTSLRFVESFDSLTRLPASGVEAQAIAGIVGDADVYTGFAATRERLLNINLADYSVLHFATHARADEQRPELSGFVLSRFDEAGHRIDETIRMQDIYAMKLNADLVVLSACQTAAGKEIKGEGVMGLNSAFLQAGARSVVASLWQVDDNASNLLMREFYRGLADGRSVSSALRDAQLSLYRDPQFRSPFFWAAFTVQGDMNRRPAINPGVSPLWLAAVPVVLLIGMVVWRFGRKTRKA